MAQFAVQVDVTMSGTFYVEANSKEEALKKAEQKSVVASDLRNFSHIITSSIDAEQEDQ